MCVVTFSTILSIPACSHRTGTIRADLRMTGSCRHGLWFVVRGVWSVKKNTPRILHLSLSATLLIVADHHGDGGIGPQLEARNRVDRLRDIGSRCICVQ